MHGEETAQRLPRHAASVLRLLHDDTAVLHGAMLPYCEFSPGSCDVHLDPGSGLGVVYGIGHVLVDRLANAREVCRVLLDVAGNIAARKEFEVRHPLGSSSHRCARVSRGTAFPGYPREQPRGAPEGAPGRRFRGCSCQSGGGRRSRRRSVGLPSST